MEASGYGGEIADLLFVPLFIDVPTRPDAHTSDSKVKQDHQTHSSPRPASQPAPSSLSLTGLRVTVTHYIRSSGRDKSDRGEEHLSTHARLHLQVEEGTPLKTTTRPQVHPRPGRPLHLMLKELHCMS